jgi:hypothetical protein
MNCDDSITQSRMIKSSTVHILELAFPELFMYHVYYANR